MIEARSIKPKSVEMNAKDDRLPEHANVLGRAIHFVREELGVHGLWFSWIIHIIMIPLSPKPSFIKAIDNEGRGVHSQ